MTETQDLTSRKRTLIFLSLVISCIATAFLATALTTALPAIMTDLHITAVTGQWLTSGYSLAMGIMMPLTAFLLTHFSTKKLYLTSLLLFIVGLVLAVMASNFPIMMIARVLQAMGSGILSAMAQVVLLTIYPEEKRGAIMGWYGLSISAAPVIAPTLAGVIVDLLSWRAIFYLSIIVVGLSFVFALFIFEDVLDTRIQKFDTLSFVLSALAFAAVTIGIGNIGSSAFFSWQVLGLLVLSLVVGAFFVIRQLRSEQPFLELRIFKDKTFTVSVLGSMLLYFIMMGSSLLMPLYAQSILGLPATVSGLLILPGSLIMAIISPFAGKLYDRFGMKLLFIVGALCLLLSNIGMFFVSTEKPIWLAAVYNALRSTSIGCLMMPLVTWGNSHIKAEYTAHSTALLTSLRTVAGAIGSAVFVGIMTTVSLTSSHQQATTTIHGLNIAFLAMSVSTLLLLALALFGVKKAQK